MRKAEGVEPFTLRKPNLWRVSKFVINDLKRPNFDCRPSTGSDLSIVKSGVSVASDFSLLAYSDPSRSDAQASPAAELSEDSRLPVLTFASGVASNFPPISNSAPVSCTRADSAVGFSASSSTNNIEEELRKRGLMAMSAVVHPEGSSH